LEVIFGHCDHGIHEEKMRLIGSIFDIDLEERDKLKQEKDCSILPVEPKNFEKVIIYNSYEILE
jgi:hypothetical protein